MSKQRKTVLVSFGKRTREVSFESGSDTERDDQSDLFLLRKAIREEFTDCASSLSESPIIQVCLCVCVCVCVCVCACICVHRQYGDCVRV